MKTSLLTKQTFNRKSLPNTRQQKPKLCHNRLQHSKKNVQTERNIHHKKQTHETEQKRGRASEQQETPAGAGDQPAASARPAGPRKARVRFNHQFKNK